MIRVLVGVARSISIATAVNVSRLCSHHLGVLVLDKARLFYLAGVVLWS